jgi:hypothetical protein
MEIQMALSKRNQEANPAAAAAKAQFEQMGDDSGAADTAVLDTPASTGTVIGDPLANVQSDASTDTGHTEPASEADAAAATSEAAKPSKEAVQQATQTAIALSKSAAVANRVTSKFVGALSEKENVFDPRSLDFNTFPRVTVGLDGFSDDSGVDLGKVIAIEVMSYNTRWVASPGTDDEEAKKDVRYSLDGQTIDSTGDDNGMSVREYIQVLKDVKGYKDAGLKEYLAIYGFLTYSNDADIDPADYEIIALQVPPQSRALFERHQITMGVKIQRGTVEASDIVWCGQEKKQGGNKKFALINFSAKKPVK